MLTESQEAGVLLLNPDVRKNLKASGWVVKPPDNIARQLEAGQIGRAPMDRPLARDNGLRRKEPPPARRPEPAPTTRVDRAPVSPAPAPVYTPTHAPRREPTIRTTMARPTGLPAARPTAPPPPNLTSAIRGASRARDGREQRLRVALTPPPPSSIVVRTAAAQARHRPVPPPPNLAAAIRAAVVAQHPAGNDRSRWISPGDVGQADDRTRHWMPAPEGMLVEIQHKTPDAVVHTGQMAGDLASELHVYRHDTEKGHSVTVLVMIGEAVASPPCFMFGIVSPANCCADWLLANKIIRPGDRITLLPDGTWRPAHATPTRLAQAARSGVPAPPDLRSAIHAARLAGAR